MHAIISGGKITSLELLDYAALKKDPTLFLSTKKDLQKFNEVSYFFERFVLQPQQRHVLA